MRSKVDTIRTACRADLPEIRALWKECFGDSDDYLDRYFRHPQSLEHLFVYEQHGVSGMMTLIPCLAGREGGSQPVLYLFALAVRPDRQGNGIGGGLMRFAEQYARREGYGGIGLVMQHAGLTHYYREKGYTPASQLGRLKLQDLSGDGDRVASLSVQAYLSIRRRFLAERNSFRFIPRLEAWNIETELTGGAVALRIREGDADLAAICAVNGGTLYVRELCLPVESNQGVIYRAVGSLAAYAKCRNVRLRLPWQEGGVPERYLMAKALTEAAKDVFGDIYANLLWD